VAASLFAALPVAASAADVPSFCADPASTTSPVDKEVIAEQVLIENGVPAVVRSRFDAWRKAHPSDTTIPIGFSSRQVMVLVGGQLCDKIGCTKAEVEKLAGASFTFIDLLKDTEHLSFFGPRDPRQFFQSDGSNIRCLPSAANELTIVKPPVAGSGEPPPSAWGLTNRPDTGPKGNIRIRGKGEDLIFADYDTGFEDDVASGKTKTKLVGAIGYSILFPANFSDDRSQRFSLGVIPYFAINLDASKSDGKAKEVDSNTLDFGTTLQFVYDRHFDNIDAAASQYLAITPHFLVNRNDSSQLLAVNALYRPTVLFSKDFALNALRRIGGLPVRFEPILDARFAYGHFTRVGSRTGDDANDFTRLGFRYGIGLSSSIDRYPIELAITDTPMFVISGAARNISVLEAKGSAFFDADKHFGVEVVYSKGRATDLDERVAKWSIGLGVRY
jgi:hypothetical protein